METTTKHEVPPSVAKQYLSVAAGHLTIIAMGTIRTWTGLDHRSGPRVAAALLLMVGLAVVPTSASATEISVDQAQRISAHGDSESLRDVVVELCKQAGIDLLGFAATDRTVSVDYDDLPMDRFLSRLLREESYVVGLRGDKDNGVRIAWLRVMGPEGNSAAFKADGQAPTTHFGVDQAVLDTAWGSEDESARAAARAKIVQRVLDDPAILDEFLAVPPAILVEEIGEHPHAVEVLKNLSVATDDNRRKFQIMGLVQSVRSWQTREERAFKPLQILKDLQLKNEAEEHP